jgi:hypothetical protein
MVMIEYKESKSFYYIYIIYPLKAGQGRDWPMIFLWKCGCLEYGAFLAIFRGNLSLREKN